MAFRFESLIYAELQSVLVAYNFGKQEQRFERKIRRSPWGNECRQGKLYYWLCGFV